MKKDRIFKKKNKKFVKDFSFHGKTAQVFDDMLNRSVPFYHEVQRMMGEIAADFAKKETNIYDLGCSTCTTFINLSKFVSADVNFVGIDSSEEMLKKGKEKIRKNGVPNRLELQCQDLNKGFKIVNASVVILNLTLQFVRPLHRNKLIREIYSGLNEDGCIILVEKVISPYSTLNRLFIKYYYEFKKRNGYSELEIAQKREALENILIPYHMWENQELLLNNGFREFDVFFRWYNFCGMVAIK